METYPDFLWNSHNQSRHNNQDQVLGQYITYIKSQKYWQRGQGIPPQRRQGRSTIACDLSKQVQ